MMSNYARSTRECGCPLLRNDTDMNFSTEVFSFPLFNNRNPSVLVVQIRIRLALFVLSISLPLVVVPAVQY